MKTTISECFDYAKATTKIFGTVSEGDWEKKIRIWAAEFVDKGFDEQNVKAAFRTWCNNNENFPEMKNILDVLSPARQQLYLYTGPDNAWSYEYLTADHPLIQHKLRNSWSPHTFEAVDPGSVDREKHEYAVQISAKASATMAPVAVDYSEEDQGPRRIEGY